MNKGKSNVKVSVTRASGRVGHALLQGCPAYSALECEPSFAALGMQQTEWRVGLRKMLADLAAAGKTESGEMAQVISL